MTHIQPWRPAWPAPYDILIAGYASSQGPVVISENLKEFNRAGGSDVKFWISDEQLPRLDLRS
jgi:hypothetical protein